MRFSSLASFAAHARSRAAWTLGLAFVGLVVRCGTPTPPARSVEGVAEMLGTAAGGEVKPEDFVWEQRGGFFTDAFFGRSVLFLAKVDGGNRDLFRARVRLTRGGRAVSIRDVHDLTGSPGGDESDLVAVGSTVAFATRAGGAVQGVTVLDLAGAREAPRGLGERLRAGVDRWLATGSAAGIARAEVVFGLPPRDVKMEVEGNLLVLALGSEGAPASLDLKTLAVDTGDRDPYRARAHVVASEIPRWPSFVAARAGDAFGADAGARVARWLGAGPSASAKRTRAPLAAPVGAPIAIADAWPPAGATWVTPASAFAAAAAGKDAPPAFAEAGLDIGGRIARLVAIDTRRIDLHLESGATSPRSATGLHGIGKLPTGALAGRVVALFASGPDGDYARPGAAPEGGGFVVDGVTLVPARDGLPTLGFTRDGGLRFGTWTGGASAAGFASLRQIGPTASADRARDRSALCVTPSGHVVYALAHDVDATSFAQGLAPLKCSAVVPLASAPAELGFAFVRGDGAAWEAQPVPGGPAFDNPDDRSATVDAASLARGLDADFVYLTLRGGEASRPARIPATAWTVDPGKQGAPTFLPTVLGATLTQLGAQVHLLSFAPGRFALRLRTGSRELNPRGGAALAGALDDADLGRALASAGLGTSRRKGARGFATGGATGIPFRGDGGVLVFDDLGPRVVKSDGFTVPAHADAVELPLTADEGKLRPEAREVGTMRPRVSACALDDGTFLLASTTFDTDEATTQALLDAGCTRVVGLDRGSHAQGFLHRTGTAEPPEKRYEVSAVYVVEAPLRGRAKATLTP